MNFDLFLFIFLRDNTGTSVGGVFCLIFAALLLLHNGNRKWERRIQESEKNWSVLARMANAARGGGSRPFFFLSFFFLFLFLFFSSLQKVRKLSAFTAVVSTFSLRIGCHPEGGWLSCCLLLLFFVTLFDKSVHVQQRRLVVFLSIVLSFSLSFFFPSNHWHLGRSVCVCSSSFLGLMRRISG
ncbi:hypothetical protein BGZ63DRAFT_232169 [Mariannaea sp. PMI_226]|nr:hypothetical protein BGZ63DRAFT_232169 [Mariannaea sp. PMI_226]